MNEDMEIVENVYGFRRDWIYQLRFAKLLGKVSNTTADLKGDVTSCRKSVARSCLRQFKINHFGYLEKVTKNF